MPFTTIVGAARALRNGSTTSVGLAEQVLQRTSMVEAQLHAYLTLDSDGLMEAAARADEELAAGQDRGPLHGIPIAVKDNMTTRHMETTAGSRILSGYIPPVRCNGNPAPPGCRRADRGQDQPRRVRHGVLDGELRLRAHP